MFVVPTASSIGNDRHAIRVRKINHVEPLALVYRLLTNCGWLHQERTGDPSAMELDGV